uniref:Palmitoyltransferase n=2 Tax=Eptatretus burgeri TaxID=7764 RepID=A0A8C4R1G8_EPTBU
MAVPVVRTLRHLVSALPALLLVALTCWSYFAYVVQLCVVTVTNAEEKVAYLLAYHILFAMFIWSFCQTIFTPPKRPSKEYCLAPYDGEAMEADGSIELQKEILKRTAKGLPLFTRTESGALRYCERCQLIKPDRCHHCSVCDICVLKMDHHCPWVNNCVGFSNYKFFLLFLGYATLYCIFITATVLKYFICYWEDGLPSSPAKFHVLFLFFIAAMFAVSLGLLFGYHCWLVSTNVSTLEAFRAPVFEYGSDRSGFDLGVRSNMRQVFGASPRVWFLPIFSSVGDGLSFPVKSIPESCSRLLGGENTWEEEGNSNEEGTIFGNAGTVGVVFESES